MSHRITMLAAALGAASLGVLGVSAATAATTAAAAPQTFKMVRSSAAVAARCLPAATANVTIQPGGPVEIMDVNVSGLPKNTNFDLFVIQVPNTPFGVSWYQGDLGTNANGNGHGRFVGRFNIETFAVAPNTAPAPSVHSTPIPDATSNPPFGPIHTFHLGLWFNSPVDAANAGCPGTVTPFNGEHNAGVQALSTRQAPDDFGPLRRVKG